MNKADMSQIIEKIAKLFNISISPMLVGTSMIKFYDIGIDKAEQQFDLNFTRDGDRLKLMENYTVSNIKDMNDDMQNKIRQEVTRGVVNLESVDKVKQRIMKVVDVSSARAKTIARTELANAENEGHLEGAKQSELDLRKCVDIHLDNVTSPICIYMDKHYGADEQAIPLDAKFKYDGKEWLRPAFHPNCRTVLKFIQVKKQE